MRRQRKNKPDNWLKRKWADWQYWWTYGLSAKRKKMAKAWKLKRNSIQRWKQSRPIEKRIQEQERKRNARKLNRTIKKAPKKLGQRLKDIATYISQAPGKGLKALSKGIKRLRKLTWKELTSEAWSLYLNVLAYFFNLPRRLYKRWKKQPVWLQAVSGLTTVILVATILATPVLIDRAKHWRAQTLGDQASELIQRDQLNLAYELSRSAALLAPDEDRYVEQAIDLADKLRHPHAVWWAERMAKRKDYDEASLSKIIEQSLEYNQLGTGARYVSVMRARYPESQNALDAELELLMRQNLLEQALVKAARFLTQGHESPMIHRVFVELALRCTDENVKAQAREILLNRIQDDNKVSLELLKLAQRLEPAEMERIDTDPLQLRDRIMQHPDATRLDRVEATGFAYFSGLLKDDEAFTSMTEEYDLTKESELEEALEQLNRFGNYYGRTEIISEVRIFSDPKASLAYMEGLIFSSEANIEEAEQLLADDAAKPLPISATQRHFLQAMIASLRGDNQAYSLYILQSLDNSTPDDWDYMHPILLRHTDALQQHAFYRELFGRPESPILAAERYLMLTYQLGMEEELQILLKKLPVDRFAKRPESLNFLLYLNALHGKDLSATRGRLEQLVGEFPQAVLFYRNLAFVYARLGEFGLAQSLNREIPAPPDSANAYIRLAQAYINHDPLALPNIDELPTQSEQALWRNIMAGAPSL